MPCVRFCVRIGVVEVGETVRTTTKTGPKPLFIDTEALNPADCKSAGYAFTGSNPVPTTTFLPKNIDVSESRSSVYTLRTQKTMKFPILVEFKGLRAKIYGKGTQGRYYRLVHLLPGHKREQRYFKLLKKSR